MVQAGQKPDTYYRHESTAYPCARFIMHLFVCHEFKASLFHCTCPPPDKNPSIHDVRSSHPPPAFEDSLPHLPGLWLTSLYHSIHDCIEGAVTTNFQIGFGQLLAKACSSSRRSTTWSVKCANILTGMSTLSLEPWKGLSIWCGRTLRAQGPTPHTFFQPLQNSPPSPHPPSLLWTKTLHLWPFPLTPDPPCLLRTTTNSRNQRTSLLPSHPIYLCFVDQTLQVPFWQHRRLHRRVWLTIQLLSLSQRSMLLPYLRFGRLNCIPIGVVFFHYIILLLIYWVFVTGHYILLVNVGSTKRLVSPRQNTGRNFICTLLFFSVWRNTCATNTDKQSLWIWQQSTIIVSHLTRIIRM